MERKVEMTEISRANCGCITRRPENTSNQKDPRGTTYNLNNGEQIFVPAMIGSSTKIQPLGDGRYLVTTRGAVYNAKPKYTVMTADELAEKYGNRTESENNQTRNNQDDLLFAISPLAYLAKTRCGLPELAQKRVDALKEAPMPGFGLASGVAGIVDKMKNTDYSKVSHDDQAAAYEAMNQLGYFA